MDYRFKLRVSSSQKKDIVSFMNDELIKQKSKEEIQLISSPNHSIICGELQSVSLTEIIIVLGSAGAFTTISKILIAYLTKYRTILEIETPDGEKVKISAPAKDIPKIFNSIKYLNRKKK